jgi:hypothetical protein
MAEITIAANIEGVEDVAAGFNQIGDSANAMGDQIAESGTRAGTGYSSLLRNQASVITQGLSLTHIMDQVAKGHLDVASAAIMLAPHLLRMASSIEHIVEKYGDKIAAQVVSIAGDVQETASAWAAAIARGAQQAATWLLAAAMNAYNIATMIAEALSGPAGWALLAGAAVAASVGIAWVTGAIPHKQAGGPISETGPYFLHAGEFVIPAGKGAGTVINNNVEINDPVFKSRSDLDYLIGRLKRMGMA